MKYRTCPKCQTRNENRGRAHFVCRACTFDEKRGYPSQGVFYQMAIPGGGAAFMPPALFFGSGFSLPWTPPIPRNPRRKILHWGIFRKAFEKSLGRTKPGSMDPALPTGDASRPTPIDQNPKDQPRRVFKEVRMGI